MLFATPPLLNAGLGTMPPAEDMASLQSLGVSESHSDTPAAASLWANLLLRGDSNEPPGSKGVYIGESLPPVPQKLASRICRWEYIDMAELLPESWAIKNDDGQHQLPTCCRRQVTDLTTWLQCFAVYVGMLSGKHPEVVSELMVYRVSIIRASEDYAGSAWVRYDVAY